MKTIGIDLRRTADHLRATGFRIGDRKLRAYLVSINAIRKTQFGYEVTPQYRDAGLLVTQTRTHAITSELGSQIHRHYTIVLVTTDGLDWLRSLMMDAASFRRVAS